MSDILIPRGELDFLLFDWLRVGDRDSLAPVLDLAAQVAADLFLPHCRQADIDEPVLDADGVHVLPALADALRRYAELGLFAAGFDPALGGLGLPHAISAAIAALAASASIATAAYPMLTIANARLIATFGSAAQIDAFARPQIAGRWFGTMCLSEPQAGSGLGDIRTRARPDGHDDLGARYRLTGNKMWISGGDQDVTANIVHLVLAKVERSDRSLPAGTRGISLFIVPKRLPDGRRNDIAVAGLNHKLGYRGTANCLLNFGERDGAVGWLVGGEGEGLAQMFTMMNEARIAVGTGAAALAIRSARQSVRYATQRLQGRSAATPDRPAPIIEHVDVRRMLLQQKAYAEGALALCLYCAALLDEGEAGRTLLDLLTPVAKSWPAEYGLVANDLAIQIHGGYGYTRDFDVEQLWRDNRLNPIHEGTTGIQGIDLLGRKVLRGDGTGLAELDRRIAVTIAAAGPDADLAAHARALRSAWDRLWATIAVVAAGPDAAALDDATLFLSAFGHVVVAWLWLEQAIAASRAGDARRTASKRHACRYFFERDVPQALLWMETIAARSDVVSSAPPALFLQPGEVT